MNQIVQQTIQNLIRRMNISAQTEKGPFGHQDELCRQNHIYYL